MLLKGNADEREQDIDETIKNIKADPELIWKLDTVLQLTMKVLGIPNDSVMHEIIKDTQAKKHADEAAIKLAITVFAIAAGLFTFGEGTVAVFAAATAAGVGGYQTYSEIQEYRTMSAASGTAFDRALVLTGDEPSLFWLAFSIAGTILDVGLAANLFVKLARAGKVFNAAGRTEALVIEVDKVIQELKITNAELKTNILKAAENEKKLKEAFKELAGSGQLYSVVDPFTLLAAKFPTLVKVSYYLAKKGIVRFEQFLLELKSQRVWDSLKGIDIEDPKIQEELKKAFEEGLERFKKNPESFDEIAKVLTVEDVKKGIVKDGVRYFPESELYTSGKHGIKWDQGPARVVNEGNPQGQFGSLEDIENVTKIASEKLKPGMNNHFDFLNSSSFQWELVNGAIIKMPVNKVWIRVDKSGRIHAYPYFQK